MKTTHILLLFILFLSVLNTGLRAESLMDRTTSSRKFYQETFKDCNDCKTITIIVSENKLNKDIQQSFRLISEKFGKKHMGSTMTKSQVWDEFEVFDRYNCAALDQFESQFVIYIDKNEKYCGLIPFTTKHHLMSVINIIHKNLDDAKNIRIKKWKYITKKSVDDYSKNNPEVLAIKDFIFEFIDYIDTQLTK